ncbi:TIGR02996 domain-containing protein [Zavarzinella formosa]|uniref:TIGR02996 domain-containing protein n=1 Tax=Zavarzinella formosa TaxID=360055 RepID=UPI0002D8A09F|nr:TIGR02996 domain-containing protein [Zavarzinella formosa]
MNPLPIPSALTLRNIVDSGEIYSVPSTVLSDLDVSEAMLAAVLRTPHDETPRKAYAAWLAANGRNERAELIRLQCQPVPAFDRHPRGTPVCACGECTRRERVRELLSPDRADEWAGGARLRETTKSVPVLHHTDDRHCPGTLGLVWNRGFVEEIRCPAAMFADVAEIVFALHPVLRVVLDDVAECLWTEQKSDGSQSLYLWQAGRRVWLGDPCLAGLCRAESQAAFVVWLAERVSRACVLRGRRLAGLPV